MPDFTQDQQDSSAEQANLDEILNARRRASEHPVGAAAVLAEQGTANIAKGDPSQVVSPEEKAQALGQVRTLKEILADKQQRAKASEYGAQKLEEAIDKAKKAYEEQSTRQDWAEIAGIIGEQVARLGAAKYARAGQEFNAGAPLDFSRYHQRSREELARNTGEAEDKFRRSEAARHEATQLEEEMARRNLHMSEEDKRDAARQDEADRQALLHRLDADSAELKQANRKSDEVIKAVTGSNLGSKEVTKLTEKYGDVVPKLIQKREEIEDAMSKAEPTLPGIPLGRSKEQWMKDIAPYDTDRDGKISDAERLAAVQSELSRVEKVAREAKLRQQNKVYDDLRSKRIKPDEARHRLAQDPMEEAAPPSRAPQSPSAPTPAAPTTPKPGEIRAGFRFRGGNPADKNNWEKVQ